MGPPASPPSAGRYVPSEVLLKFKDHTAPSEHASALGQVRGRRTRTFRSGAEQWKLGQGVGVEEAVARLKKNPHIRYVEPNYLVGIDAVPNDPRYPEQYALNTTGQTGGTPGADIHAESAWSVTTGSHSVVVAVIDTGVDTSHPDLQANLWTNPGEIAGNGIDDDGNGYVDDVHGWDFINHDNNPFDDNRHGTHVAGILGAAGNNAIGIAGVSWQVSIMPLKFIGADGFGSDADAIAAIEYSGAMGARISNNSWSGPDFSQALLDAINGVAESSLFVTSAASSDSNNDLYPPYPASFDAPNVVAVTSTDANDQLAPSANYGPTSVDLGAPGVSILSTMPGNTYGLLSGTSMAAPQVCGAAALILAIYPDIDVLSLKNLLLATTDPLPSLAGKTVSGGRLNAYRPLAVPDHTAPGAIQDLAADIPHSNSVTLTWTATGEDGVSGTASSYELRYSTTPIDNANFVSATRATNTPAPGAPGTREQFTVSGLQYNTSYYFAVKARDEVGNAGALSNIAIAATPGPPVLQASPLSMDVSLVHGETATRTLTLHNTGEGDLAFSSSLKQTPETGFGDFEMLGSLPVPLACIVENPLEQAIYGMSLNGSTLYRYHPVSDTWDSLASTSSMNTYQCNAAVLNGRVYISSPDEIDLRVYEIATNSWGRQPNPLGLTGGVITSDGSRYLYLAYFPTFLRLDPTSGATLQLAAPPLVVRANSGLHYLDGQIFAHRGDSTPGFARFDISQNAWAALPSVPGQARRASAIDPVERVYYVHADYQTLMRFPIDSGVWSASTLPSFSVYEGSMAWISGSYPGIYFTRDGSTSEFARVRTGESFLRMQPRNGTIPGDGSSAIQVTFDAGNLVAGSYGADIQVATNVPSQAPLEIPVTLGVTGLPEIALQPTALDFPSTFTGSSSSLALRVINRGTDDLHVDTLQFDGEFSSAVPLPVTVPVGGSRSVAVDFTPTTSGPAVGTLFLHSDDPRGTIEMPLTGSALAPPIVQVAPASLHCTLYNGHKESLSLSVSNVGDSDLVFSLIAHAAGASSISNSEIATVLSIPGGPGSYQLMTPSPEPLTGVVEDPTSGMVYARSVQSENFYRYRAGTGRWEQLASAYSLSYDSPSAALLNGKIYLPKFAVLEVYDIATDVWTGKSLPTSFTSWAIASDESRYLYLLSGSSFFRLDPAIGGLSPLPTPPIGFTPYGGMRYLNGILYAHQGFFPSGGSAGRGFASFDIAQNSWLTLPSAPENLLRGSAIDPISRQYLAVANNSGSHILAFSIDSGAWSVSPFPGFSVSNGGMG